MISNEKHKLWLLWVFLHSPFVRSFREFSTAALQSMEGCCVLDLLPSPLASLPTDAVVSVQVSLSCPITLLNLCIYVCDTQVYKSWYLVWRIQYLLVVCVIHIKVQNDLCWKYYYFRGCELREIISNFTTFSLFPVLNVCAIGKQWRVGGRRLMEVAWPPCRRQYLHCH